MKRIVYNALFPVIFLFFLPGMLWKLWRRPGYKRNYKERFARFDKETIDTILALGSEKIWVHAVSVGESQIAVNMIRQWREENPNVKIFLSTTTTTGQAFARSRLPDIPVIFCPLDFFFYFRKCMRLFRPKQLVIFETEIWPEMIYEAKAVGAEIFLVNGRMSDRSSRGYRRVAFFFAPILRCFKYLCVQTDADRNRYKNIAPDLEPVVTGNMKFDQPIPETLKNIDVTEAFGTGDHTILLAASTHPGEEVLVAKTYQTLREKYPNLRLIIVPRHAERGAEIEKEILKLGLSILRRSTNTRSAEGVVDVWLADTTGEMLPMMSAAQIVLMGKSLAGHDEGHNLIEPALLGKPILTGAIIKNFRFVLDVLKKADAVRTVANDDALETEISDLLDHPDDAKALGERAKAAISVHTGATRKTIDILEGRSSS